MHPRSLADPGHFLERATRFRRLAGEILDGPFRRNLIGLAQEYEDFARRLTGTYSNDSPKPGHVATSTTL